MKIQPGIFVWLLMLCAQLTPAGDLVSDAEALALGRQVLAVKAALEHPEKEQSLEAIKALGQDSRYYVMVRGWVIQHLQMAESFRDTSEYQESAQRRKKVDEEIAALKKALRMIDLE